MEALNGALCNKQMNYVNKLKYAKKNPIHIFGNYFGLDLFIFIDTLKQMFSFCLYNKKRKENQKTIQGIFTNRIVLA